MAKARVPARLTERQLQAIVKKVRIGKEAIDKNNALCQYLVTQAKTTEEKIAIQNRHAREGIEIEAELGALLEPLQRPAYRHGGPGRSRKNLRQPGASFSPYQEVCRVCGTPRKRGERWICLSVIPPDQRAEYYDRKDEQTQDIRRSDLWKIGKTIRRQQRKKLKEPAPLKGKLFEFHVGDALATTLEKVKRQSVHAIITDPPYGAEFLELYSLIPQIAEHALVKNGICLVMTGQTWLPEILNRLSKAPLSYHWTIAYLAGGESAQIWGRKIASGWKPIIWLLNGKNPCEKETDVIRNPSTGRDHEKDEHEWGQSIGGHLEIIDRYTLKNQVILDPFCGAGTTNAAAVMRGRKAIGIDIDREAVMQAAARIERWTKRNTTKGT
jgi:16S rRNA G966 N2-methylase RsmD